MDRQVSQFEPKFEPQARFDCDSGGSVRYGKAWDECLTKHHHKQEILALLGAGLDKESGSGEGEGESLAESHHKKTEAS